MNYANKAVSLQACKMTSRTSRDLNRMTAIIDLKQAYI